MNSGIYVVLEHYLALTFEESFLIETKSYNSPIKKWQNVLNRDLNSADLLIRDYLLQL